MDFQKCSEIMIREAAEFLRANDDPRDVIFCLYDDEALAVFERTLSLAPAEHREYAEQDKTEQDDRSGRRQVKKKR